LETVEILIEQTGKQILNASNWFVIGIFVLYNEAY